VLKHCLEPRLGDDQDVRRRGADAPSARGRLRDRFFARRVQDT
jgi:hypothetical protein